MKLLQFALLPLASHALCGLRYVPPMASEIQRCPPAVQSSGEHAVLFHLGSEAIKGGELTQALAIFRRAGQADPSHAQTRDILSKLQQLDLDVDDPEDIDTPPLHEESRSIDGGRQAITTLAESTDATGPTAGPGLWASAPALVEWLCEDAPLLPDAPLRRRELIEGRAVIELGSGTGFVGLSLAKLGASRVLLTDLPQRLPLLRRNIDANGGDGLPVDTTALAWGATVAVEPSWDLIVATDVTYDADLVPLLASTVSALLRRSRDAGRQPRALLALPQRSHFRPPVTAADGTVLPDAALLVDLLRRPGLGALATRRLATLPSAPCPIDILLVSVQGDGCGARGAQQQEDAMWGGWACED